MIRTWLLLGGLICLAVPACCEAVGQAGQAGLHGSPGLDVPVGPNSHGLTVGHAAGGGVGWAQQAGSGLGPQNALGAAIGVPQWVQERLMNRETVAAAVGVLGQTQARALTQNALGAAAVVPEAIRERLMARQTVAAAIGIPVEMRQRLMVGPSGE